MAFTLVLPLPATFMTEERLVQLSRNDRNLRGVNVATDGSDPNYTRRLGEALVGNTVVWTLIVSDIEDGIDQSHPILQFIETSQELGYLHLAVHSNHAIALFLRAASNNANTSISTLCMSPYLALDTQAQLALAAFINSNRSIVQLSMQFKTESDATGGVQIANALRDHPTLKHLFLGRTCEGIATEFPIPIYEVLYTLPALKELDMGRVVWSFPAVHALCRLLRTTRSLQTLSFRSANLGGADFLAIWSAIEVNATLQNLNFNERRNFNTNNVALFTQAMNRRRGLNINVSSHSFSGTTDAAILSVSYGYFGGTTDAAILSDLLTSSRGITVKLTSMDGSDILAAVCSHDSTTIGKGPSLVSLDFSRRLTARGHGQNNLLDGLNTTFPLLSNLARLSIWFSLRDNTRIPATSLLSVHRNNGTLLDMVVPYHQLDADAPNHDQAWRLLQAFFERNRRVPILLKTTDKAPPIAPRLLEAIKPANRVARHRAFLLAVFQGEEIGPTE